MEFRHEWKHEVNLQDVLILRQRLQTVMRLDEHAINGMYQIRSLYFDTPADTALRDKLDGVNPREKFRLRYYNGDVSRIFLEKKSKIGSLESKETTAVTKEEVKKILEGELAWMGICDRPLVGELYRKMTLQGLMPKTIVDYTREPYVYAPGNVRVTLDQNIRTGLGGTDFLNLSCVTVAAGDGERILEVKWDAFLPEVIRDIVQLEGRRSSAFSKYAVCRCYG